MTKKTTPPVEDITSLDDQPAVEGEVIDANDAPSDAVVVSEPVEGEPVKSTAVAKPEKRLKAIAVKVRTEFGKGLDSQFAIGHLLDDARNLLPSDTEFGKWLDEQNFPFRRVTALRLRQAAQRESEVREFIAARSETNGRDISANYAVELLNAGPKDEGEDELQATGKRVRDLMEDEAEPKSAYPAFHTALGNLDLQVLTIEELTSLATDIQTLAVAYKAEKARRSA